MSDTRRLPCLVLARLGSQLRSWFENFLSTSLPLGWRLSPFPPGGPCAPFGTYVYVAFRPPTCLMQARVGCGLVVWLARLGSLSEEAR